jgi:hypothetical protein
MGWRQAKMSTDMIQVVGIITGLSQYYVDGVERVEIWIDKKKNTGIGLPNIDGKRIPINFIVRGIKYFAGIRSTLNNAYIWICPALKDAAGAKVRLADLLKKYGM